MPTADQPFALESHSIDALPLVTHVLARLRFEELLTQSVPAGDRRYRLAPAKALGVLVRNLLLARVPLYSQAEWAARAVPQDGNTEDSTTHVATWDVAPGGSARPPGGGGWIGGGGASAPPSRRSWSTRWCRMPRSACGAEA